MVKDMRSLRMVDGEGFQLMIEKDNHEHIKNPLHQVDGGQI